MIQIPLNAKVNCTDGVGGASTQIIINPITQKITHLVVQDRQLQPVEHQVNIDLVAATSAQEINLNCTIAQLEAMEPLVETHYIRHDHPDYEQYLLMPYATIPANMTYTSIEEERIPLGELAVRRGTLVEASDGYIGKINEFLVDSADNRMTHLVISEGHLWRKKELTIPVATIDKVEEDTVYLNLTKAAIENLPDMPIERYYDVPPGGIEPLELLILIFDQEDTADRALKLLKQRPKEERDAIVNAAVITKDAQGKTDINEIDDLSAQQGAWFGAVTGGLIGLLVGPIGAVVGAAAGAATGGIAAGAIDLGFSDQDLKNIQDKLQPGSSALVALVKFESAEAVLYELAQLNGTLMHQTLTEEMITRLMRGQNQGKWVN